MADTETITVNVRRDIAKRFRKLAGIRYGRRKGYLGRAFDSAMSAWMARQESEDIDLLAIEELKKGYHLGGIKYKGRGELHDR